MGIEGGEIFLRPPGFNQLYGLGPGSGKSLMEHLLLWLHPRSDTPGPGGGGGQLLLANLSRQSRALAFSEQLSLGPILSLSFPVYVHVHFFTHLHKAPPAAFRDPMVQHFLLLFCFLESGFLCVLELAL